MLGNGFQNKDLSQRGFTLIELAIVIIVLSVITAIAVPRFVDLQVRAQDDAIRTSTNSVQSTFALYIADNFDARPAVNRFPTVQDLADRTQVTTSGSAAGAVSTGVSVSIGTTDYIIQTYTNTNCSSATTSTGDRVKCVLGFTET